MQVGQLIHCENFSLFEAMVAIEIMNPKMDAAILHPSPHSQTPATGTPATGTPAPGTPAPNSSPLPTPPSSSSPSILTPQDAISAGLAPTLLTPSQLLDIFDSLISALTLWFSGQSLAQTLFSSLYLMSMPHTRRNPILHAFCSTLIALCNSVRSVTIAANAREEEDFVTASFGLPLVHHIGPPATQPLRRVHTQLAQILASQGASGSNLEAPEKPFQKGAAEGGSSPITQGTPNWEFPKEESPVEIFRSAQLENAAPELLLLLLSRITFLLVSPPAFPIYCTSSTPSSFVSLLQNQQVDPLIFEAPQ